MCIIFSIKRGNMPYPSMQYQYPSIQFIDANDIEVTVRLNKEQYEYVDVDEKSAIEYLLSIEEIDNGEDEKNN